MQRLPVITFIQELKMASETGRMSVSVTPEKQQKLDAIASSLDRSRNWSTWSCFWYARDSNE